MYCSHFNLQKKPFQLSSDNSFLWLGKSHARALDALKLGIKGPDRSIVLTGDVGTGKTTLLHEIIQTLPPDTDCAHITDPSLELHYLFQAIARGLGFESLYQEGEKFTPILMSAIQRTGEQGRKAVIIIDEVHLIPDRFLTRLMSWSRRSTGSTLTILLAGQLEFHDVITKSLGRSWNDHVDIHARLDPLDEEETLIYINQRLALAGARRRIFMVPAVHQAHLFSKGIPRLINIACDQAMIAAFSKGMTLIDGQTFQEAVGILELPHVPEPVPGAKEADSVEEKSGRPGRLLAGLATVVVLATVAYYTLPRHSPAPPREIAAPLPEPVQEEVPPETVPETNNQEITPDAEAVTLIPPAIQPSSPEEEHHLSPPADNIQAEFYSPPEKEEPPVENHALPEPKPKPVDMKKFIEEVFMIPPPAVHEPEDPEPVQAKSAAGAPPPFTAPETESGEAPAPESQPPQKSPEPDAIIDWILKKNKP